MTRPSDAELVKLLQQGASYADRVADNESHHYAIAHRQTAKEIRAAADRLAAAPMRLTSDADLAMVREHLGGKTGPMAGAIERMLTDLSR